MAKNKIMEKISFRSATKRVIANTIATNKIYSAMILGVIVFLIFIPNLANNLTTVMCSYNRYIMQQNYAYIWQYNLDIDFSRPSHTVCRLYEFQVI